MRERLNVPEGMGGEVWLCQDLTDELPPHAHDELELNLVLAGSAQYLLRRQRYDLSVGSFVWLFPGQQHMLMNYSPGFVMWVAVFTPELVSSCVAECPTMRVLGEQRPAGSFCRNIPQRNLQRLDELMREIRQMSDSRWCYRSGIRWLLSYAWKQWNQGHIPIQAQDIHPSVAKAATRLRQSPELSLTQLAPKVGLSPSRLSRLFKREVGCSLVQFRNECKVNQFLQLFGAHRERTMLDCALESGFGSYEQFHRAFRQQMGCSPSVYYKQTPARV